jgi:effector-binding domain-containing protein
MNAFKKIFFGLLILIIILVVVSYLLPDKYKVEKSVNIKADKSLVFDLASHFVKWDLWTVWTKETDSTVVFEMSGNDGQVGAIRKWNGKILQDGELTAEEIVPEEVFVYELKMDKGKFISQGKLTLEPEGDSCKVTWSQEGDLGYNPIARYFGLFMDKMLAPDFEKGLARLKKIAEERNQWPAIELKINSEQKVLLIRDSAGPQTYGNVMGKAFGEVMEYVKSNHLVCTGPPFAIYVKWDSVTMFSVMDLGISVEQAEKGKGRIRAETIPAQEVAVAHYFGGYDKTASTYNILEQFIRESGKTVAGAPWEVYITDPTIEKDTTKWATDILFPVK